MHDYIGKKMRKKSGMGFIHKIKKLNIYMPSLLRVK